MNQWKLLRIFIPIVFLLTGCWGFEMLENRIIITGIGVDKLKEGYQVGTETIEFQGGPSGQAAQVIPQFIETTIPYRSIEIPLHQLQDRLSGSPFYPNIRILVIGKEQAEAGIADIISHFIRDPDMRRVTQVIISDERASDVMKIKTKRERTTSLYLESMVKGLEASGRSIPVDIGDISRATHEEKAVLVPVVAASPTHNEAKVIRSAVLEKGKIIDYLNQEETFTIALFKGKMKSGSLQRPCPKTGKGSIAADITAVRSSVDPKIVDGKLVIEGKLKMTGSLSEYTCGDERVRGRTSLKKIGSYLTKEAQKEVNEKVNSIIHRGVDVLDLKTKLEKNPAEWKNIKAEFPKLLKQAEVNLDVKVELLLKGTES